MMKRTLFTTAILLVGITTSAQYNFVSGYQPDPLPGSSKDLSFEIKGSYNRGVTDARLYKANRISDLFDDYPVNWIGEYISLEIMATNNGKPVKALSTTDVLTAEQKIILRNADLATDITTIIKYKSQTTSSSKEIDKKIYNAISTMNNTMTVIPETQARYIGGYSAMREYLKTNAISKISESTAKKLQAKVTFIINEAGTVENAKISRSSDDLATDKLLLEAIKNMPKWTPAQNFKGIKVKQQFEFTVGMSGC